MFLPRDIQEFAEDFVLLAADERLFHYHNHARRLTAQERGLAVYLDVSVSVNQRQGIFIRGIGLSVAG